MWLPYKDLWDASIGEDILKIKIDMLWLYSKMTSLSAKKLSLICSLFLARGGAITCMPIGGRRYSSHLQLNLFAIIFGTKYFQMQYYVYLNFV